MHTYPRPPIAHTQMEQRHAALVQPCVANVAPITLGFVGYHSPIPTRPSNWKQAHRQHCHLSGGKSALASAIAFA